MKLLFMFVHFISVYAQFFKNFKDYSFSPLYTFINNYSEWKEFVHFQDRFNKTYDSLIEFERRFEIFKSNFQTILLHNSDTNNNSTMTVNKFTDLTPDEFKQKYISGLKLNALSRGCKVYPANKANSLPETVDWRLKNAVTSVKDQGQCGSCWAFSSTGAVEGYWAIYKGQLLDLSEQQLVDCATGISYGSHGCNGGQMDGGFKYIIENGQCELSSYPYTAMDGNCQKCESVVKVSSCYDVVPNDQLSLKAAVSQQPVSIAIEADTRYFQFYSSGVLTSTSCGTNLDHGVLIVGYGEEDGQKYWLVKNSWGSNWGDNGYVKIARSDSTNDKGICGVAMQPSFPSI